MQKIEQLIERYHSTLKDKRRLKNLKHQLFQEQEQLLLLKEKVEDEYADIQHMEKKGLKQVFIKLLVNREEQLKKERQDYLMAVLKFRECKQLIVSISCEMEDLQARSVDQEIILDQIERELEELDDTKLYEHSVHLSELKVINKELQKLLRLKVETNEALDVTKSLHQNFLNMIKCLNQAQDTDQWGKYYSEIQDNKKKHKANVDKARSIALEIKRLVVFLKGEIEDVIEVRDEFRRTEAFIYEFNISFYDHLLEDWIADNQLAETLIESTSSHAHLVKMKSSLEGLLSNVMEEYNLLIKKKKAILKSLVMK